MHITEQINNLHKQYEIVGTIDLGQWTDDYESSTRWLIHECQRLHRLEYEVNQRIVFIHTKDYYVKNEDQSGLILKNLQIALNEVDISNFFAVVVSTNPALATEMEYLNNISADTVPVEYYGCDGEYQQVSLDKHPFSRREQYQYGSSNPIKINLNDVDAKSRFMLSESKTFCIYPWIHMHAWPTGQAYPCCHAKQHPVYGNARTQTLKEIWNADPMKKLRVNMLNETASETCAKCYEQEDAGFFSGRQSANKHHGHHIHKVHQTQEDGTYDEFAMSYWDIRFSNLCNLKCRSCGHIFSSQWYQDQAKLAGGDWKERNTVLNIAGRNPTDMWEQLIPHLDYVEQIYFAGGEPLLMDEHYQILDELDRRGRYDVRLIYNTNFTHTELKDKSVFEYWKKFHSVAVGASLDAMGPRGEYIRKGTEWDVVEANRREMLEVCPRVDFYISPTLSIMNALHLPDFHRDWVEKGLLNPQDLNVNILQDPYHYRIDIAPMEYKQRIKAKFEAHLEWLRPLDHLNRATVGFESAINFMMSTDNTQLIDTFWRKTYELDNIRNENVLDIIPELAALK
jgi:MoaA/NifB/PqqE/SkfB family radical SAM enzyme